MVASHTPAGKDLESRLCLGLVPNSVVVEVAGLKETANESDAWPMKAKNCFVPGRFIVT